MGMERGRSGIERVGDLFPAFTAYCLLRTVYQE
jgi:hypothetical protein